MKPHLIRTRAVLTALGLLLAAAPAAYATLADEAPAVAGAASVAAERGPAVSAPVRGKPYIESRLLFGTERPDGGPAVSDRQFMSFVDREITPDFPDGLTVQSGRGQWRDAHGTIEKERSYVLTLLCPERKAGACDRKIEEIRRAYEKAFGQESVGRVDERARVDL